MALGESRRTWGMQRTNRCMSEALYCGLYCRLRFNGSPIEQILLAALVMQVVPRASATLEPHALELMFSH